MVCEKCGYDDNKNETIKFNILLCSICNTFAPNEEEKFQKYIFEKIDWKTIDTFRNHGEHRGHKQKSGMKSKAQSGLIVTRAAYGYSIVDGRLVPNEESAKVHALFREFLQKDDTLKNISNKYGVSINGLKKILKNRTYLGEIKFDQEFHKGNHTAIISPEIFYEVQRKLNTKLKPRKGLTANKHVLKGTKEPLKEEKEKINNIESEVSFMKIVEEEPEEMYSSSFDL